MPRHHRIRLLAVAAVLVIAGSVWIAGDRQRSAAEASSQEITSAQDMRALVLGRAADLAAYSSTGEQVLLGHYLKGGQQFEAALARSQQESEGHPAREPRLLRALEPTVARVPRVLAVGADESIIGAPFYVMERCEGHVITKSVPEELDTPEEKRRMSEELIDSLVEVHSVDWEAAGLEGFGKPTGYLERQLRRFTGLWEHNRTRDIPQVETVGNWLAENVPESGPATIVHGDYRLGNTMLATSAPASLVAIFDWEMATIGDPLADLGYLCTLWVSRDDPSLGMFELSGVTRQDGFYTRAELVTRYEERSGRSMTDIRWYQTLALWKSIVFMEGNYKRAVSGTTDDPYLRQFGDGVILLARRAEEAAFGG